MSCLSPRRVLTALLLLPLAGTACAQDGAGLRSSSPLAWPSVLGTAPSAASTTAGGIRVDFGALQLGLSVNELGASRLGARLMGNYFLTGPGFGDGEVGGGLRLTSGLSVEPRLSTAGTVRPGLRSPSWALPAVSDMPSADGFQGGHVTLPYIGIGYTSQALRGGWGLTADIGLGGLRPGQGLRLSSGNATSTQVEKLLNDLRLAPVLQLGVSYSF